MIAIGIDVGSSSIKGVLCDDQAVIRSEAVTIPLRLDVGDPLKYEHNALEVRAACFQLIQRLAKGEEVDAISFTGQMHGGLVVDSDLSPVTNIVTWQDRRQNPKLESIREVLGDDPTGVGIHSGFLVATIAANALAKNSAYIIGIYDWIASLIAGRAVTDIASAAAWGMYDPIKKQWRDDVLKATGITHSKLPEVFEPCALIGSVSPSIAKELHLSAKVKLFAGTGDTQATYIGSGCERGDLLLNFGTGSQSLWETDRPMKSKGVDIRYFAKDRWLATSPTEAGGESYRIFAEFVRDVVNQVTGNDLTLDIIFERLNIVAAAFESKGIVFDPAFAGSKVRDADTATIAGLTRQNFKLSQVTAALLEGMIREISEPYFEREDNRRPSRLFGGGSAMRMNPALRTAAERFFGMPIELPKVDFEAAYGVARQCVLAENGR